MQEKRRAGTGLTAAAQARATDSACSTGRIKRGFVFFILCALGSCATPVSFAAKPVRFEPPDDAAAWEISGQLMASDPQSGDAAVTVWVNGQRAAAGKFQIRDGIADGSFTGAYSGRRVTVHCTNAAPPRQGFLCDIGDGLIPAGTLAFVPTSG
jgi:hypothetical protein